MLLTDISVPLPFFFILLPFDTQHHLDLIILLFLPYLLSGFTVLLLTNISA